MLNPITTNGVTVSPYRFAASLIGSDLLAAESFYAGETKSFNTITMGNICAAYPETKLTYIQQVMSWLPDLLNEAMIVEASKHHAERQYLAEDTLTPTHQGEANHPYY